jgi:hypothetical protein
LLDLVPVALWDDVEAAEWDDPQVWGEVVDVAALEAFLIAAPPRVYIVLVLIALEFRVLAARIDTAPRYITCGTRVTNKLRKLSSRPGLLPSTLKKISAMKLPSIAMRNGIIQLRGAGRLMVRCPENMKDSCIFITPASERMTRKTVEEFASAPRKKEARMRRTTKRFVYR